MSVKAILQQLRRYDYCCPMNRLRLFAFVLLFFQYSVAQQRTGTLCVAARIDDPFWKESATLPNGQINSHGLQFGIDKRSIVKWPEREGLKVEGLDTAERHLVSVRDSKGKPIEAVWFKFSDFKSTNVCMSYDGYQRIGLRDLTRHTPWCKCH
jgi:hypothetical protein